MVGSIEELNSAAPNVHTLIRLAALGTFPLGGGRLGLLGGRRRVKLLDLRQTTPCSPTLIRFAALSTFPKGEGFAPPQNFLTAK